MSKIIKHCVGIDVSQKEIDVTFGSYGLDQSIEFSESRKFKNNEKGFSVFVKWILKRSNPEIPLFFVMEATGVYHERLACFLYDNKFKVSVILPNRASAYSKSLEVKTVTDKEASRSLTRMGLEKKLPLWEKPDPLYNLLKQLTREREQLQHSKTICMNQIHAESSSAWINTESLARAEKRIKMLEDQILEIEKEIQQVVAKNPDLKGKLDYLTSIPGIGIITAVTVIAETNGFSSIKSKRQLVSYSGYDVIRKDSGTSVSSKPRISKKGNRHIRKAMYFPSLTAIRHNQKSKDHYLRMVQKHGIKMKGAVAIQRKLLVLMYTLWKNKTKFDPQFAGQTGPNKIGQLALP